MNFCCSSSLPNQPGQLWAISFSYACFWFLHFDNKSYWLGGVRVVGAGESEVQWTLSKKNSFQSEHKLQAKTNPGWCYFCQKTQPFPPRTGGATIMCLSKERKQVSKVFKRKIMVFILRVHRTFMFEVWKHYSLTVSALREQRQGKWMTGWFHMKIYFLWAKPISNHDRSCAVVVRP